MPITFSNCSILELSFCLFIVVYVVVYVFIYLIVPCVSCSTDPIFNGLKGLFSYYFLRIALIP